MSLLHALQFASSQPTSAESSTSKTISFRRGRRRLKKKTLLTELDRNSAEIAQRKRGIRSALMLAGTVVVSTTVGVTVMTALSPFATVGELIAAMQASAFTPIVYGVGAVILPALFISQTMMTLAAGVLFGPVNGAIISITAQTLSALLAYGIGTQLSQRTSMGTSMVKDIEPYIGRLRQYPFESMLMMRLIYLPQEAVSYAVGMLNIGWKPLALGTLLGSLPSTIFLTQAASAVSSGVLGTAAFNPVLLLASGGVFAASIVIARQMRDGDIVTDDAEIIEGEIIVPPLSIG